MENVIMPLEYTVVDELLNKGFENQHNIGVFVEYKELESTEFGTVNLKASFPCFLPSEHYPEPDMETIQTVASNVVEYLTIHNVPPTGKKGLEKFRNLATDMTILGYFSLGDQNQIFTTEVSKLAISLTTMLFSVDDLLDESSGLGDMGVNRAVSSIYMLGQHLRGNKAPYAKQMEEGLLLMPSLIPYRNCVRATAYRLRELRPDFTLVQEYVIQGICNTLLGMLMKQLAENDENIEYHEELHKYIRSQDAGGITMAEMSAVLRNVKLSEEIRMTFLFQEIMRTYGIIISHANDLFSLGKEVRAKGFTSPIVNNARREKISLAEAFTQAQDELRRSIEIFFSSCRALRMLYPESEELDRFLLGIGNSMDLAGHLLKYTTRYGDAIIYTAEMEKVKESNGNGICH